MIKLKKCTKCGSLKLHSEFDKRTASKDCLTSQCKICLRVKSMKVRKDNPETTRAKNLKSRFDMTIEQYNIIFLKQKGKCVICQKSETIKDKRGSVKWLSIDHDHNTGKVRGLLCNSCNTGLGKMGDSIKVLESAIKYLKKEGSYGEK